MSSKANISHSRLDVVDFLDSKRGKIHSKKGGWQPGTGVFCHGYSMLDELVGEVSYFQILLLNATGKLVDKKLAEWVEAAYGCLSWPDPRIWCNQIGALSGTARTSVVTATAIGCMANDSKIYGARTLLGGVTFIQEARKKESLGMSAEDIVEEVLKENRGKPNIVGYRRPIAKGDERIETLERVGKRLGFEVGPHLSLAYSIEQILLERFDEGMNINGFASAFLSDQAFTETEVYRMFALIVASGVTACYVDTLERPAESFVPLRCDDIDYQGASFREVPEPTL